MSVYKFLGWTSPGLQQVLINELKQLKISAIPNTMPIYPSSAVFFRTSMHSLQRVLYTPNTLTFLNLQIAHQIQARNPKEYLKNILRVQLHAYIPLHAQLSVKCHIKQCTFNHSKNWQDTILSSLESYQKERKFIAGRKALLLGEEEKPSPQPLHVQVNAYLYKNKVTLYLQLHGESLHKHGSKKQVGSGSLSENVAVALVQLSQMREGWTVWDPFCGCGTILLSAMSYLMGLNIRQGCFEQLHALPIFNEQYIADQIQPLNIPLYGTDKDSKQISKFNTNLDQFKRHLTMKPSDSYPSFINCKTYENLEIAAMDYQAMYKTHLKGQKLMIISNPPWNKTLPFSEFNKMIQFMEKVGDECYLIISSEQYRQVDHTKWAILAEPLVGGLWTKIIHYKKGSLVVIEDNKNQQVAELQYHRDISEYQNDKTIQMQQHVQVLASKINNKDYIENVKVKSREAAEEYGERLTKLKVGKKTMVKQLVVKEQEQLIKTDARNKNLMIQRLKQNIRQEQIEMKKVEVKDKLIIDKFQLDKLNAEEETILQQKLNQLAKQKSVQMLKSEKKKNITIPKW